MSKQLIAKLVTERNIALLTMLAAWAAAFMAYWVVSEQIKETRELTSQQFFIQFYSQWESEDMQHRRAELARRLLGNPKTVEIDDAPLVLLETVANATRRGLVDRELVYTTFSVDIVNTRTLPIITSIISAKKSLTQITLTS